MGVTYVDQSLERVREAKIECKLPKTILLYLVAPFFISKLAPCRLPR